jgi:preprotein translocase subunit YajC
MYPTLLLLQAAANPLYGSLFMYVAIAAIFYFVLWRPQQRQRKAHDQTVRTLKRGDEIVTVGGIVGEVVAIKELTAGTPSPEDQLTIRSGESRLIVERGRVARVAGARGATPAA